MFTAKFINVGSYTSTSQYIFIALCLINQICNFIQINQPTICNDFSSLLLDVYVQHNMFRASSRPSSGAQQQQ